jgi:hypothetical protein
MPCRVIVGVVSLALLVSGVGGAVMGGVIPPKPAWSVMGFEAIIAMSAIFGLLLGAGRLRDTPALTVLCVAGAALAGGVLEYLSARASMSHLPLKAWLAGRLLAAIVLGACSVALVLGRHGRAWGALVRAVAWGVPLAAAAAWYRLAGLAPLNQPAPGLGDALRLGAIALVATLCAVCLCASVHFAVRAFTIAIDADRAAG